MKAIKESLLLVVLFLLINNSLKAQFVFEHKYDSTATYNFCQGNSSQLMMIKLEVSGERYIRINRCGKRMSLYDLNHVLIKHIDLSSLPTSAPYNIIGTIFYISENLFNTDGKLEFMYVYDAAPNAGYITKVYDENLNVLFSENGGPMVMPTYHMQQYPIYNTSQGTKLIISYANGDAKVFGLTGTLTAAVQNLNQGLIEQAMSVSASPNPSFNRTRIDYQLPEGGTGDLVISDMQGNAVKRYKVDSAFDHVLIDPQEFVSGTYIYWIEHKGTRSEAKKLVIIR
jgi:hypothetical protein